MRAPSDLRRRKTRSNRGRVMLIVLAVALVLLITSLRGIAGFYTDYLWFDSLGFSGVFRDVLGAKIALALIFTALFFVLCWINLWIADRIAPRFPSRWSRGGVRRAVPRADRASHRPGSHRRGPAVRTHRRASARRASGRTGSSSRTASTSVWTTRSSTPTSASTSSSCRSCGSSWTGCSRPSLIIIIITAVAHYLNGGIRVQTPGQRVTPQVKAHLSVLLAALALVQGGRLLAPALRAHVPPGNRRRCQIHRRQGTAPGHLPVDADLVRRRRALLIVNIWRRGWVLPVLAVGLVGASSRSSRGGLSRRSSSASRSSRPSRPRRRPTSSATSRRRARPWVSTKVSTDDRSATTRTSLPATSPTDDATFAERAPARPDDRAADTYQRCRAIRPSTTSTTSTSTVTRSTANEPRSCSASASSTPRASRRTSWEGRHLAFTHGYGVGRSLGERRDSTDAPTSSSKRPSRRRAISPVTQAGRLLRREPRRRTSVVDTSGTRSTTQGRRHDTDHAVRAARAAWAWTRSSGRPRSPCASVTSNPLISNFITGESQDPLHPRRPASGCRAGAVPVLRRRPVPGDPRRPDPCGSSTRYTTTDRTRTPSGPTTSQLPDGSGLGHRFNYVRNSVKAVVDAYDGTVTFTWSTRRTRIDPTAYQKAFPELFTDFDEMPDDAARRTFAIPRTSSGSRRPRGAATTSSDAAEFYEPDRRLGRGPGPGTTSLGNARTTADD